MTKTPAEVLSGERLVLRRLASEGGGGTFARDVEEGLAAAEKSLKPKYFYDELGSVLFEAICLLEEYYPTRTERSILGASAADMVAAVPGPLRLVELGSGSSAKTRILIEALLARQGDLHYLPIDISASALERSANELLQLYPGLHITACAADYSRGLGAILDDGRSRDDAVHTLVLFLGSTIGNLEPADACRLLREVRSGLEPGDGLLLGADLKKAEEILLRAYDDALGVTAAFNLNLLGRINRELGGAFDLRRFAHRAVYDRDAGRIELHLVSRERQRVAVAGLDLVVELEAGESIHTESSYKYDRQQLAAFARESGFRLAGCWQDDAALFSVNLLEAAG